MRNKYIESVLEMNCITADNNTIDIAVSISVPNKLLGANPFAFLVIYGKEKAEYKK